METAIDHDREYHGYYLDDYDNSIEDIDPCDYCELCDHCDEIADTTNNISYCICLDSIKDKKYKNDHPHSYFKKIKNNT